MRLPDDSKPPQLRGVILNLDEDGDVYHIDAYYDEFRRGRCERTRTPVLASKIPFMGDDLRAIIAWVRDETAWTVGLDLPEDEGDDGDNDGDSPAPTTPADLASVS